MTIFTTQEDEVAKLKNMYWRLMDKVETFKEFKKLQISLEEQIRLVYGLS